MRKPFVIRIFLTFACFTLLFSIGLAQENDAKPQETSDSSSNDPTADPAADPSADPAPADSTATDQANQEQPPQGRDTPDYPIMVAVKGDTVFSVDLNWPGVWKTKSGNREVLIKGSEFLRKALNRPRAITVHPKEGVLVGCSASREIYHIQGDGSEPMPLNDGILGNVMALTVSPDGSTLYVGDTETRALWKLPIEGGKPELVTKIVNPRGLAFIDDTTLLALTPDANAIYKIDVSTGESEAIVKDRPYQFANNMVWAGDIGYVSDTYGKCIWTFDADGKTSKWFEGEPLQRPVGLAVDDTTLYVSDPLVKQVFLIDRKEKKVSELWAP